MRSRRGRDGSGRRLERGAQLLLLARTIRKIPAFVRLLAGLAWDRRVALADKLLVAGALAYVALPTDMVLDAIPFLGLVDDVFLLSLTIRRLIRNAGLRVALRYWTGSRAELRRLPVEEILAAASLLLPRRVTRSLRRRVE